MIPVSAMIQRIKLANGTPFIAFNAAAILFVIVMLFAPILSHFATRSESIADNAAQLAHFQNVMRAHDKSAGSVGRSGDPFLADNEERIASADLQAHLKSLGANAGVTVPMTSEPEHRYTELRLTPSGTAFLTDAIVVMRYIEVESQLRRMLAVVKVRASAHSNDLREFTIDDAGIRIGKRLLGQEGLLGGRPTHNARAPGAADGPDA